MGKEVGPPVSCSRNVLERKNKGPGEFPHCLAWIVKQGLSRALQPPERPEDLPKHSRIKEQRIPALSESGEENHRRMINLRASYTTGQINEIETALFFYLGT